MKYSNFSACPYLKEKLLITFSLGWPNCHNHALPQTIYHAMASILPKDYLGYLESLYSPGTRLILAY